MFLKIYIKREKKENVITGLLSLSVSVARLYISLQLCAQGFEASVMVMSHCICVFCDVSECSVVRPKICGHRLSLALVEDSSLHSLAGVAILLVIIL